MKHQHRAFAGIFGTSHMSVAYESGGAVAGSVAAETAEASAAAAPQGPAMLIELDPAVRGNLIHDRFDIMIRGRAISNAAIAEIRLQVGEQVVSTVFYGQSGPVATATLPDGRSGQQRAFQFNLPRRPHDAAEQCAFSIIARTGNNLEGTGHSRIGLDPQADTPVALVSGRSRTSLSLIAVRASVIMYVERALI